MRIVIEIEGTEITAKNLQATIESKSPPADVLEKAASIGAQDAGPAPTQNMGAESSSMSSQKDLQSGPVPAAENENANAGAAPQLPSGQ